MAVAVAVEVGVGCLVCWRQRRWMLHPLQQPPERPPWCRGDGGFLPPHWGGNWEGGESPPPWGGEWVGSGNGNDGGRGSSTKLPPICLFFWWEPFSLKPLQIEIKTDRRATKRETIFDNAYQQIDCTCQLLYANQSHNLITSMSIAINS
jgi:hypothetical protein